MREDDRRDLGKSRLKVFQDVSFWSTRLGKDVLQDEGRRQTRRDKGVFGDVNNIQPSESDVYDGFSL